MDIVHPFFCYHHENSGMNVTDCHIYVQVADFLTQPLESCINTMIIDMCMSNTQTMYVKVFTRSTKVYDVKYTTCTSIQRNDAQGGMLKTEFIEAVSLNYRRVKRNGEGPNMYSGTLCMIV